MEKINWYGTYCLSLREIKRFIKVYHQTIITPVISSLIFLSVFVLAIGNHKTEISGIKFINFMGYGLIIMSIMQNAFSNSSSSFIMSKILGYIIDILTPPLGSIEIVIALTLGSLFRGLIVGIVVALALYPFIEYEIHQPLLLIFYVVTSCTLLAQFGILSGLISNSFDQLTAVTSYLITPLSFLSGTFYSVTSLPVFFQYINLFNPFFYMIDGFRYCLTNHADGNITIGITLLIIANILQYFLLIKLIDKGWRLKS
ncbi:MAG: multidrug ABC transporter permease [Rickettsiales bacterium]|nr:MAG: multidrug ABC transporter permease [Rickettsiales bacterium]